MSTTPRHAQAISRDGFLYTGDLGYKDAAGLHLTGGPSG